MKMLYEFCYRNGYVFEIMLSVFFFTWWMQKRKHFKKRVGIVCVVLVLISMITGWLPLGNILNKSVKTIVIFFFSILGMKFCYEVAGGQAVFYVTAAGAAQHFAYKAARMLLIFVLILGNILDMKVLFDVFYAFLFILFVSICHFLFGKKLRKEDIDHLTNSPMVLFLLIGMQLCTNIFQNFFDEYEVGIEAYTVFSLFDMICCLFLLALQCEIAKKENEQRNNEVMKQILYQQKQQMRISKETIELINIKCHDIKNQIAMLGKRVPKEEIKELENAINIYDTALKTGNEALDVLLMEKQMVCESKNIHLDCIANGEELSFIKQSDIYSLFGNAIDNAIEAVDKIRNQDRRFINIKVRKDKGMVLLHFENFYEGEIVFYNGLPKTTKQDTKYHGFGMKSIRMITEKYGGYFSVKTKNGIFTLNILLTQPK